MAQSWANSHMQMWLRKQEAVALYHVALRLNWDLAHPTLYWIINRPDCDRVTAAHIFWTSDPRFEAQQLLAEEDLPGWLEDHRKLRSRILKRWREQSYPDHGYGIDPSQSIAQSVKDYQDLVAPHSDPLALPSDLFGPFDGQVPQLAAEHDPTRNPELWDLFRDLGTTCGARPGERVQERNAVEVADARLIDRAAREEARRNHAQRKAESRFVLIACVLGILLAIGLILFLGL